MKIRTSHNKLITGAAFATLILGGGVLLGHTIFIPSTAAFAQAEKVKEEGRILMDETRAKEAGIFTEAVQAGGLGAEIIAQGVVASEPDGEAALTARADGAITRISKRLGDSVLAGETIALLESRDAAAISAEVSKARARVIAARATHAREQRLFSARVTARQELEAVEATLSEAEAELKRSKAAAHAAHLTDDGRSLEVVSLISGRITKSNATLGAYVIAGTELFRVSDPSRVQFNASVLATDARRVKSGDTAVIELTGGETVSATVRSATPSLDPNSKTVTIVLTPQGVGELTSGQGLRARINPSDGNMALIAVTGEAVQSVKGKDVVFLKTPDGFQSVPVVTGKRSSGRIEIVDGLKPGDVVVTKGAFLLKAELGKSEAEE